MPWFTIVGVVRDVKQGGVNAKTGTELYFLNAQGPAAAAARAAQHEHRDSDDAARRKSLAPQIRRIVQSMDPTLPIVKLRSMDDVFAGVGVAPALPGAAAWRLRRAGAAPGGDWNLRHPLVFGERAAPRDRDPHGPRRHAGERFCGMVLGQGLRLTVAGLVAGLVAAFGLTRLLQAQLFNVRPSDPATMAVGCRRSSRLVALAACYIPASRATRVDPMVVLRDGSIQSMPIVELMRLSAAAAIAIPDCDSRAPSLRAALQ